jgi:putative PIN family toxin of toxin-antitoxin system
MTDRPRIVLDTNILLASIGTESPYRWVFEAILDGQLILCVSTPILREYEAVIGRKTTVDIAENVLRALTLLPNVERVRVSYRWHLIERDPDDNVFVDTAVAAGAHAIVTHDAHFDVLSTLDFPTIEVWNADTLQKTMSR